MKLQWKNEYKGGEIRLSILVLAFLSWRSLSKVVASIDARNSHDHQLENMVLGPSLGPATTRFIRTSVPLVCLNGCNPITPGRSILRLSMSGDDQRLLDPC
jgi:hypothetical protein